MSDLVRCRAALGNGAGSFEEERSGKTEDKRARIDLAFAHALFAASMVDYAKVRYWHDQS